MEKIIETKICKKCSANFEITDKDLEFYKKISPKFDGKVYEIPAPTLCPECRQQRRLSFRNERKLYKRDCDATGKQIISIYSPDKPYKIYNSDFWWSDKWDALDYGIDFNFEIGFFEQFNEIIINVPKIALHGHVSNENSLFTNYFISSKDCYFCFGGGYCDNVYHSYFPLKTKDSIELFFSFNCENCYELTNSDNCYKVFYSENCINCGSSYFINNCVSCKNCFGCNGLVNKQYFIFNEKKQK